MIHIPEYIPGTVHSPDTRIQYFHILNNGTWKKTTRSEFFRLESTVESPNEHICPDLVGGTVWFIDSPTALQRQGFVALHQEAERDKKRVQRFKQCPCVNTAKCDGWKRDADGYRRCDICTFSEYNRTTSLNAPINEQEGGEEPLIAVLPGDSYSPEDTLVHKEDIRLLRALLANLPENDRQLLIARFIDGLDCGEIAARFGLSNQMYASKKIGRILTRIRKSSKENKKNYLK